MGVRTGTAVVLLAASFSFRCGPPEEEPSVSSQLWTSLETGASVRLQAVSAADARIVWVSGLEGTYGRSLDGGETWAIGTVEGAEELQFRDVHAVDADIAYLLSSGPGAQSRIYKTRDGGASFHLQFQNEEPDGFFDCFDFWDEAHGLAYGDSVDGHLVVLATSDGETWNPIPPEALPDPLPGEGGFAASGTCVTTLSEATAYVATGAGSARLLRTRDRGASWEAFETPVVSATESSGLTSLAFWSKEEGLVAGGDIASDEPVDNVAVTTDGGTSFALLPSPTFGGAVYGLAAAKGTRPPRVVAVGPGGASVSFDGGRDWRSLSNESYWSVTFASDSVAFLVGPDGRAARLELR